MISINGKAVNTQSAHFIHVTVVFMAAANPNFLTVLAILRMQQVPLQHEVAAHKLQLLKYS